MVCQCLGLLADCDACVCAVSIIMPPLLTCRRIYLPFGCCCSGVLPQVASPDMRRELLSHSMLKSYQTQAPAGDGASELTVGLLVPHVSLLVKHQKHCCCDRQIKKNGVVDRACVCDTIASCVVLCYGTVASSHCLLAVVNSGCSLRVTPCWVHNTKAATAVASSS